jgi:hypothetical protein
VTRPKHSAVIIHFANVAKHMRNSVICFTWRYDDELASFSSAWRAVSEGVSIHQNSYAKARTQILNAAGAILACLLLDLDSYSGNKTQNLGRCARIPQKLCILCRDNDPFSLLAQKQHSFTTNKDAFPNTLERFSSVFARGMSTAGGLSPM